MAHAVAVSAAVREIIENWNCRSEVFTRVPLVRSHLDLSAATPTPPVMLSFSTLTSSYPSDGIATSFGVTRWNNCSAGFPFCVAGGLGLPSVEYTEYYARSVDLFAERAGPLSLLPASENQKTVIKWNTSEGAVQ